MSAAAPQSPSADMSNPAAGIELEPEPESEPVSLDPTSGSPTSPQGSVDSRAGSRAESDDEQDEDEIFSGIPGLQRMGGLGGLKGAMGQAHKASAMMTGAAPVVDFRSDEFHDDDLGDGMAHLRPGTGEMGNMRNGSSVMGTFKTEQERHQKLMDLIAMATGETLNADGDQVEADEDDLDWDVDEELFKYASVEGMSGKSLKIFGPDHPVRTRAAQLVNHQLFEYIIMGIIVVTMFALGYDTPARRNEEPDGTWVYIVAAIDWLTVLLFTGEAGIRIIAQGFVVGKGTYLHNGWNILDFVIVGAAWTALILKSNEEWENNNKELIEICIAMRLIRPLHSLRYFKGVETLLAALSYSGPQMATVTMLMTIFFVIFGSFGIELWQGVVSRTCGEHASTPHHNMSPRDVAHMLLVMSDANYHGLPMSPYLFGQEVNGPFSVFEPNSQPSLIDPESGHHYDNFTWGNELRKFSDLHAGDLASLYRMDKIPYSEHLQEVGVGVEGGCPKTMTCDPGLANDIDWPRREDGSRFAPGTCFAVPDQYAETGEWMDASNSFGCDFPRLPHFFHWCSRSVLQRFSLIFH